MTKGAPGGASTELVHRQPVGQSREHLEGAKHEECAGQVEPTGDDHPHHERVICPEVDHGAGGLVPVEGDPRSGRCLC